MQFTPLSNPLLFLISACFEHQIDCIFIINFLVNWPTVLLLGMWGSISLLLWFCFLRSLNVFKYISGHDKTGEVYKILKRLLSSVRLNTSIWMLLSFIFHCQCTALCTRLQMMVPLQSTVGLVFCWVTTIIWLISLWLFATASHGWICIAVRKEVCVGGWGGGNQQLVLVS